MSAEIDTFIASIKTFLATNIGVSSIRHPDGRTITLDRKQALAELQYWTLQNANTATTKPYKITRSRIGLKGDA